MLTKPCPIMELASLAYVSWTQRRNVLIPQLHGVLITNRRALLLLCPTLQPVHWTLLTVHWPAAVCSAALRPSEGACRQVTALLAAAVQSSRILSGVLTVAAGAGFPSRRHRLHTETSSQPTQTMWLPLTPFTIKHLFKGRLLRPHLSK